MMRNAQPHAATANAEATDPTMKITNKNRYQNSYAFSQNSPFKTEKRWQLLDAFLQRVSPSVGRSVSLSVHLSIGSSVTNELNFWTRGFWPEFQLKRPDQTTHRQNREDIRNRGRTSNLIWQKWHCPFLFENRASETKQFPRTEACQSRSFLLRRTGQAFFSFFL